MQKTQPTMVPEPNTQYDGPWAKRSVPYREGKAYDGAVFSTPEDLLIYRYAQDNPGLYLHEVNFGPWLASEDEKLGIPPFNRRFDALRIPGSTSAHRWLLDGPDLLPVLREAPAIQIVESKRRLDIAQSAANVIGEVLLAHELLSIILPAIGASATVLRTVVCCESSHPLVESILRSRCGDALVLQYGSLKAAW